MVLVILNFIGEEIYMFYQGFFYEKKNDVHYFSSTLINRKHMVLFTLRNSTCVHLLKKKQKYSLKSCQNSNKYSSSRTINNYIQKLIQSSKSCHIYGCVSLKNCKVNFGLFRSALRLLQGLIQDILSVRVP